MNRVVYKLILPLLLLIFAVACQGESTSTSISHPDMPQTYFEAWGEARDHHCINQDHGFHDVFWELSYESARNAVGGIWYDRALNQDGEIVEGGYLNPADVEAVVVQGAKFGQPRLWLGRPQRVLTLSLILWVTNPWKQYQPYQSSPRLRGDSTSAGSGVSVQPDGVSENASIVRHYSEGLMDEETCEVTYFKTRY